MMALPFYYAGFVMKEWDPARMIGTPFERFKSGTIAFLSANTLIIFAPHGIINRYFPFMMGRKKAAPALGG